MHSLARNLFVGALFLVLLIGMGVLARRALDACAISVFGVEIFACAPPPAPARPPAGPSAAELLTRDNERLSDDLRRLELRLASLRSCPAPPPAPMQPIVRPPPKPPEPPKADPPPQQPPEQLRVPERLEEIAGCWQSIRGDLPLVSDDEREVPMGNIRECLCFGTNGRGRIRQIYTDGIKCDGLIQGSLADGKLTIEQPQFSCGIQRGMERGHVRARIVCSGNASGGSECTTHSLGRMRSAKTESYIRVSPQHCSLGN